MRNIAIFVSGKGEAAERIVNLFFEGNRVKTVLVVTTDINPELEENLLKKDITLIKTSEQYWEETEKNIIRFLKDKDVKLIALDGFTLQLNPEVIEAVDGKTITVSDPWMAPKEVVAELESDLRQPKTEEERVEEKPSDPTLEQEWADSLKIRFTPPKVPPMPQSMRNQSQGLLPPQQPSGNPPKPQPVQQAPQQTNGQPEPMPPTYLLWSILSAVFCCFIPGIVAIVFSSMVSSKYFSGDLEGAKKVSRRAEIWIIVSVVLGVLSATLYLPIMLVSH